MTLADLYLIKKIQGGNIREFERFFEKYYGPLCHHAEKILKDMNAAEDVVQELFYQIWKNRASFRPRESVGAYLFTSVRNNALHQLERLSLRRNYADRILLENGQDPADADQDQTGLNDLGDLVQATLQRMPDRCAHIFRLNRFEGLKYREIAVMLNISVKTVEADMGKALQLFRKSLKDYTSESRS
jgi:RNA polymerase sigma-70 factor (ECF subfamily)